MKICEYEYKSEEMHEVSFREMETYKKDRKNHKMQNRKLLVVFPLPSLLILLQKSKKKKIGTHSKTGKRS